MAEPIWNRFLTERDKQVFAAAGYGARAGFGNRPALLVIDVNYNFCGDRAEPILESIKRWRNACGAEAWDGVARIRELIDVAHAQGVPVIYTTGVRRLDNWDSGSWSWKNSRTGERLLVASTERDGDEIVDEIAPEPHDIVVLKQKPSGFFGTNLLSYLVLLGCDSVIVTGTTTSGCVRATVLDAFSNNFRVIVAEEACFDRSQASHAINLCDMQAKYADVLPVEEVKRYLAALPKGLFELPRGAPPAPAWRSFAYFAAAQAASPPPTRPSARTVRRGADGVAPQRPWRASHSATAMAMRVSAPSTRSSHVARSVSSRPARAKKSSPTVRAMPSQ
jgi:maleamate amidohydrolase